MALWSHRLPDDLAARFDEVAQARGGRSALLRELVEAVLETTGPRQVAASATAGSSAAAPKGGQGERRASSTKITIRLRPAELAALDAAAAQAGLYRTQWLAALIRSKLWGGAQLGQADRLSLRALHGEMRAAVTHLGRVARDLGEAIKDGRRALDSDVAAIGDFLSEAREIEGRVRGILAANAAAWRSGSAHE